MPTIIKPEAEIERSGRSGLSILRGLERYGRACYQSEHRITANSAADFVRRLIRRGHFSVIEHEKVTARVVCDRGVSHEIVRHRLGSYSQESTRYCDYARGGLRVIEPLFFARGSTKHRIWLKAMAGAEAAYQALRAAGAAPQEARLVLPHSVKTEIIVTYNLREWRHFFQVRCAPGAHPQIREVACLLLARMQTYLPVIFEDFKLDRRQAVAVTNMCPSS
ncbi:MAG: FAD-dependent thymidylate synthase [Lentisphaerae bacterium]|nr:FAD-dependent thymidylate synthase [Lentisphaerota bacterium]